MVDLLGRGISLLWIILTILNRLAVKHKFFAMCALQVLIDVQKQMNSFDAELKDARRGAEEMWQARHVLLIRGSKWVIMP